MEATWYLLKDNQRIYVPLEKWVWHVVYEDNTELYQFELTLNEFNEGVFHQFSEIDIEKVKLFEMISTDNPTLRYSVDVSNDISNISHFYRRSRLNIGTPSEVLLTIYCFSYDIINKTLYNFILPDGRLVTTTNKDISLLLQ